VENRLTVAPLVEEFADMSQNYLSAYEDTACPQTTRRPRFEDIQKALEDRWIPRQRQILGAKYPPARCPRDDHSRRLRLKAEHRSPSPMTVESRNPRLSCGCFLKPEPS